MSKSAVITARVSEETLSLIDQVAKAHGRSRARLVAQAVERFAEQEAEFLAFLQEGEDDIARGAFYTQEEMETWIDNRRRGDPTE